MNKHADKSKTKLASFLGAFSLMMLLSPFVNAVVGTANQFAAVPPVTTSDATGLVMLVMSNDHQLYVKAYTDYTDLDGDGELDITYTDTVDYDGYFDQNLCYTHNGTLYSPSNNAAGANLHHCSSSEWSGNFLNWATMTRIDMIRKVLYGGYRSTQSASGTTILERSTIPRDVHAFAKLFSTSTTAEMQLYTPYAKTAITLCNVTGDGGSGVMKDVNTTAHPPKVRVADGTYKLWASGERRQCAWSNTETNTGTNPSTAERLGERQVRVAVCQSGFEEENCTDYPNGSKKPTGFLQTYSENGALKFGLITGSYEKNISGGLLRSNIKQLQDNATASQNEIDSNTGEFINQGTSDAGIINTLNRLRISQFSYGSGKYADCSSPGISVSDFKTSTNSSRQCRDWGNPLSEMYLEAVRYFSGAGAPTPAFDTTNDGTYINGGADLRDSWTDPMPASEWCAQCSVIVISTGSNSFDTDELGTASDIPGMSGAGDVDTETNAVGTLEGIGGSTLIGKVSGTGDGKCTAKALPNLAAAEGVCAEMPSQEGGYQIAGLAYHAHTTDLRQSASYPSDQIINTYSVALAESLPSLTFNVGSGDVTLLPGCQANSSGSAALADSGWRNCSMADLRVQSLTKNMAGDVTAGSLLINWEDSTWGNDYDMDGIAQLDFCIGAACSPAENSNEIRITTTNMATSAGHAMAFGFIATGTTADGAYINVLKPGGNYFSVIAPAFSTGNQPAPVTVTLEQGTSAADLLKNPLWYTAKYGGFDDQDSSDTPVNVGADNREWDSEDEEGNPIPDGIPDNYFQVRNPGQLGERLGRVFDNIVSRVSAGTAAAVVANSANGTGAVYQALYQPQDQETVAGVDRTISWAGTLHALFIDKFSQFREDSDSVGTKGVLDNCSTDPIVSVTYNSILKETQVQRYLCDAAGKRTTANGVPVSLGLLETIWDANDVLASVSDVVTQRPLASFSTTSAATGRYIVTAIDADTNPDGIVGNAEVVDFVEGTFNSAGDENYRLLNAADRTEAGNIVNYLRGQEITGFRPRTFSTVPGSEVWRLGDIIHSTPVAVGRPSEGYDTRYNDTSYRDFRIHWKDRRQMVYVGANDGMIHAFSSGFYNPTSETFSDPVHPLGSEMWAYVPYNLLPHLRWLTDQNYPHVYYMDGPPIVFDANIFTPDTTSHINGWGTVLVMGMRFGGNPITLDHDGSGGTADVTFRSAYVILDITDPESPPKLIAEITDPNLDFTTSKPSVVSHRVANTGNNWITPATNNWYLAFGSGPNDLATARSNNTAKVFLYDLASQTFLTSSPNYVDTSVANSFVGDITTADWNRDYQDDAIYFGLSTDSSGTDTGQLRRIDGTLTSSVVLNPAQPITAAPEVYATSDESWVFAGTGRLYVEADKSTVDQQSFYGIKEPVNSSGTPAGTTFTTGDLYETTDIDVFLDSSVDNPRDVTMTTFNDLETAVEAADGWYFDYTADGTNPSTRTVTAPVQFRGYLLFNDYTPDTDICEAEGESALHVRYAKTGTAYPFSVIGTQVVGSDTRVLSELTPIAGLSSSPVIHQGTGNAAGTAAIISQDSGGGLSNTIANFGTSVSGRASWREIMMQ